MGKIITGLSMSLDGFIGDPQGEVPYIFDWYGSGDTEYRFPSGMLVKISAAAAELMREINNSTGALVHGRKTFDQTNGWGGQHPLAVPTFIVTHSVPHEWIKEFTGKGAPFTFVTDGLESAIEQARQVAGNKNIVVAAASLVQQCLSLGLLDEFTIHLAPVLLGQGIRLFDHLNTAPIELEQIGLLDTPGVTHITYRVVK
jgi:dihydrofolate reductase